MLSRARSLGLGEARVERWDGCGGPALVCVDFVKHVKSRQVDTFRMRALPLTTALCALPFARVPCTPHVQPSAVRAVLTGDETPDEYCSLVTLDEYASTTFGKHKHSRVDVRFDPQESL